MVTGHWILSCASLVVRYFLEINLTVDLAEVHLLNLQQEVRNRLDMLLIPTGFCELGDVFSMSA